MKTKLFLLLALLTQGLSFAQTTGTSYEPIRWDKGSTAIYGRVLRDYSVYPDPAANSAFYSAISAGSLEVKPRVGPAWLSARITYLQSQKYLEVEATGANNVQMKFERVDGSAMTGANPDGVNLSSGQFYYPGQISVGGYTKIWTFGKTSNGIGGIDLVPIKLTFKNADTGETYVHSFTPINKASRAQLFVAANSSPPVTTPTWVSARYTYAASTAQLAIESAGEAMQLKFERVDGLAMVGSNPDGVSLSSGIYYGNGTLSGQGSYDKQWTFGKRSDGSGGIPTVPIRLTFKRNSDNSTFAFEFTPASVTRQQLFVASGTPVASCNFDITTAGQTVGCGAGVTLSAAITGADASGVSITWTGNGINQLGQSVGINAPTTNGTYAYVATASKNGCSNKTATASVTVSGCTSSGSNPTATAYYSKGFGEGSYDQLLQSAPFTPSVNQYSSWPTGNTTQYLDNGIIRFGIGRAIGGAIKHLSLSGPGQKNWVNTFAGGETAGYFEGEYSPDTGRSGGWSMYGTPGHNFNDGGQSTSVYYDTGWNPVHGGSIYGDRSPITWFERRTVPGYGEVLYCRTTPYMWALHGVLAKITYHCWWWLEGNTLRYFSIHENYRDDNQMVYRVRENEGPFLYTTADLWHHYVHTGNNPGTGEGLTDISSPPVFEGGQGGIAEHFSQNYNSGEGWIASVDDNQNGIIMLPQHNARFKGGQFQSRGGDEFTNASSYINSAMLFNEDVRSTVAFGGYFYVGNLNTFRQWYNTRTIERPDFSWNFGTNNTCGWWSLDAPARFVNNRYSFQVGLRSNDPNAPNPNDYQAKGYFNSPSGIWKASDISNIYIKAAFPANCTNWTIYWKKPGNDNNQEYSKDFTSSPTSNVQTVTIPMQGTGNWNGIISSIRIKLRDSSQSTNGNEELVPTYIGNVAPNAIADWQTLIGLSILAGTALRKRRHALGVRTKKPVQRLRKGAVLASLLLACTLFSCEQATQRIEPVAKSVVSPASGVFEGEYSPDSNRPGGWSMYGTSDSTKLIKLLSQETGWNWPTGSYAQKLKARP